ncbi:MULTISPECIES: YceI family protein [unclassified Wenzhouxiangella]|uniref:YceI family protein n=1 Tax=unclassified Wenzhouxiangella TaxID=2613841 RepID=UPI000E328465|nr:MULTISPECIES: YceI family protein [unclassified Wenzhouxiangella]RFF27498.1 YceI family protein [Wenzhouxiangella sp. 15181]RFP69640.1 YceI family protein [Wenzhouxiangella sp. 15190]
MNTTPIIRCTLAALALGLSNPSFGEPVEYQIDEDHFSVGFLVEHVGYADTLGQFLEAKGSFVYNESANELNEGEVIIQADSVFTNHEKRDEHLRNDDFLDADDHETIRFEATEWRPKSDKNGTLVGDLTLLGQTQPVELDVTINKSGEYPMGHGKQTLGVSARTTIKRSEWGMTYGVEGDLVGDEVELIFEFEANRQ